MRSRAVNTFFSISMQDDVKFGDNSAAVNVVLQKRFEIVLQDWK